MNLLTKRKLLLYLALIFIAGGVSGAAIAWNSAQNQRAKQRHESKSKSRSMKDVCDRMRSRLQSRLNLTPAQLAAIDPILDQTRKELEAAHRHALEQVEQIMQKSDEEIAKHLSDEQKPKLKEMEKERRAFSTRRSRERPQQ